MSQVWREMVRERETVRGGNVSGVEGNGPRAGNCSGRKCLRCGGKWSESGKLFGEGACPWENVQG